MAASRHGWGLYVDLVGYARSDSDRIKTIQVSGRILFGLCLGWFWVYISQVFLYRYNPYLRVPGMWATRRACRRRAGTDRSDRSGQNVCVRVSPGFWVSVVLLLSSLLLRRCDWPSRWDRRCLCGFGRARLPCVRGLLGLLHHRGHGHRPRRAVWHSAPRRITSSSVHGRSGSLF